MPCASRQTVDQYMNAATPKSSDPRFANWWGNTSKYMVSLLKSWYGDAAIKENGFGYFWLPKCDDNQSCDVLRMIDDMCAGKIKGFYCIGQNPCGSLHNTNKVRAAMTKLEWMVHVNIFDNKSASFWKWPGLNPRT